MTAKVRCAIYTRKSTDDWLEQSFNSLDAQREACEAFVLSQRGNGWLALPAKYDDGGVSGGSLNRPALQALMADIGDRRVDLVVVYKVDRLTRSLNDFAKLIELFDQYGVSFVSVTQQFNTTTSMGRLTLNMLLSFAQFEREVTAERIRDKIAASKRKGMWMGGPPPLGYDVADRKLVINPAEAETVRKLFRLYLELGNARLLKDEADRRGILTKCRPYLGRLSGGKPFSRGNLYQLLGNPLYAGEVPHKGKTYPGEHEPIIDRETWDAVQARLAKNAQVRHAGKNAKDPSLLAGLVYDETGDLLSPSHATKNGRRYRYYISRRVMHGPDRYGEGWRVPARELEEAIVQSVCGLLRDGRRLIESLCMTRASPGEIRRLTERATALADELKAEAPQDRRECLRHLIRRATLSRTLIRIELSRRGLSELLSVGSVDSPKRDDEPYRLEVPMTLRRRGVETRLVMSAGNSRELDERLIRLVTRSHRWIEELSAGTVRTVRQIARHEHLDESDVGRFLPLAFLAPDIVKAVVEGRQPLELTAEALRHVSPVPSSWERQHEALGFTTNTGVLTRRKEA